LKRFNSNRATKLAILGVAISSTFSVCAQETQSLDAVQVTATRSEIAIKKSLASVTIITRAQIEQSQAPDLADLLSQQAGLDITRTGGAGSNVSVFTRGSNSNHSLILIDGIRVNNAVQGSFDFSNLPIAMVERIEIVRGPRAALWGSDAIGGVIQIFTRDPQKFAQLRIGSYGRAELDVGMGVGDEDNNFGVVLGYGRLSGFSATNAAAFGFDPDNDGYRNRHLLLRGKTSVGNQALSAFALATKANIEFDQGATDQDNRQLGLNLAGNISERWQHSLSLSHSYENLETPVYGSVFGSRRLALDWVNSIDVNEQNRFNVGLNWSQEKGFSEDFGVTSINETRRNTGVFASWYGDFSIHRFELAVRHDDNNQFGGKTTAQAAWGIEINDGLRLRASWGQGFRAPNFNELYYPGFFGLFTGNPNLQPEESNSFELGLRWNQDAKQQWEISAFRTRIDNLIAFEGGATFQAININKAALDGFEAAYQFNGEVFSLKANASWLDARNDDTGAKLLRRADRKLNINTNFKINEQWSWGLDLQASSKRPDFGNPAAGYGRVDARLGYQFAEAWSLEARIENLADKNYALIPGYNTPGRSGLVSLRWNGKN
jgi:vitamin B12 transporter